MTKKQQAIYCDYLKSNLYSLSDAYGRYSNRKEDAWNYIKVLMRNRNGYGLKVISHNGYMFTAGFLFDNGKKMMYITKSADEEFTIE